MTMRRPWRLSVLATHLTVSIGWVGAVLAYIALDVAAATSQDVSALRSAYVAMGLVAVWVIVPLAVATFATGVWISLGTKWGLFRHYWVVISLVLTIVAVTVLLVELRVVLAYALVAADPASSADDVLGLGNTLPHSVGGLLVLLLVLVLNVYKPRGLTRYGWRKQQEDLAASRPTTR